MGKKSKRNKNKQQKSNGNRAQRTGQTNMARGYNSYVELPPTTEELFPLLSQDLADQVADVLLSPHRRHGLVPRLREKSALSSYLQDVFCVNAQLAFLFVERLLDGLVDEEGDSINWRKQINDEGDEMSILALVCQWKQFEKRFGWKGKSEMVKIILAHPQVDVNECMPNGCNTAFFCLKYADAETLRYVIEAGCDMSKKDMYGNSLLKNAVEYPDPDVLQLLLEHVSATETFSVGIVDDNGSLEKTTQYTAIDHIFLNYSGVQVPVSWRILGGPPPLEKTAECLVMLRQHGTKITFDPDMVHYRALSLCFESIPDAKRHQIHAAEDMKKLGECLLGVWFPPTIQSVIDSLQEKLAYEEKEDSLHSPTFCTLCKEEYNKPFRLYCGHSFCRHCIITHGKHETNCPVCFRKLCLDVAPCRDKCESDVDVNGMHSNDGNVEQNWKDRQLTLMKGVKSLSNEQIMAELSEYSLNFSPATALETLMNKIKIGHQEFVRSACKTASMEITKGENAGETIQVGGPILEMTATHTLAGEKNVVLAPSHGPVWIEIVVKGVPILASISNNSRYTIVSPKFSETFKLKQISNLTTSKMRCGMTGKRLGHSTCLEEFSFNIGPSNTEVKLRNVIESASFTETVGIQLGQDFFLSGRYCAVSVASTTNSADNKDFYSTADGTCSYFDSTQKSESLRYYAHNGDIVKLPLIHFKPRFNHAQILVVTVKDESTFHECNYCCRTFPKWKYSKCCDDVDYCNEKCQKASRKVHKIRKPNCGN